MAEYCTLPELADLGINPAAFVDVLAPRQHQAVQKRSDYIDGYLGRYSLPLASPWSGAVTRCCAILSSIDLIRNRGVSPEDGEALDVEEKRQDAWLDKVAAGTVILQPELPTAPTSFGAPHVISAQSRGFSIRGTSRQRGPFETR